MITYKHILCLLSLLPLSNLVAEEPWDDKDSLKSVTLNQIVVQAKTPKKYKVDKISNSLRLSGDILEVPQNIQVIDISVLKDQFALNMNESVTRNVSGTFREELHNGISSDIYARGGYINAQRNGVDLRPLLKGPLGDDVSNIESIEFVKGPSGFMNALGDPAGSYNIITKKPTGIKRNTVTFTQGSFGLLRAEADLDGVFDDSRKLLYRINLMGMHKKGFLKFDNNDRIIIAPSLKYIIDDNTSITAEYSYQRLNYMMLSEAQISPYGFGSLPIDFTITDPSTRPYRADEHNVFINFNKSFNENWSLTTQISNINSKSTGAMYWVYGKNQNDPDTLDRYYVYDAMKYNTFSAQAFTQGRFTTGSVTHNFLAGIDYNHKSNKTQDTWNTATTIYPLSISNPQYSNVINNGGIGGDWNSENGIDGVENRTTGRLYYFSPYIMDEIGFFEDKLMLNAGLRMTRSEARFNQYGDKTDASDWVLSPRAGINYLITNSLSVYGLFDNTFLPLTGKTHDGSALKPIKGQSFEAGIKKEWFKAFTTTLSAYHIKRSNTVVNDPFTNEMYQSGENKAKGIEVDIRGRLFEGLNVTVNYAYTDSKITKDDKNPEMVGRATPNRIRHIQNTWVDYSLPRKVLDGFSVSLGYQYMAGRTERFTSAEPADMKNIFRMDAGVAYVKRKFSINFMVNNVFDSHQYTTGWKRNDMYYWVQLPPVNYRCSLTLNL